MPELNLMAPTYMEQGLGIVRKHMKYLGNTTIFRPQYATSNIGWLMQKRIALYPS